MYTTVQLLLIHNTPTLRWPSFLFDLDPPCNDLPCHRVAAVTPRGVLVCQLTPDPSSISPEARIHQTFYGTTLINSV